MTYHDSIKQADKKMKLSVKQLQQWNLPALPNNYAVSYEYINGKNLELVKEINQQLSNNKPLDNFFIDEIYRQFILGQSKFRDDIIDDVDTILSQSNRHNLQSSRATHNFISTIDDCIKNVNSTDPKQISSAVVQLRRNSDKFKQQQKKLLIFISSFFIHVILTNNYC